MRILARTLPVAAALLLSACAAKYDSDVPADYQYTEESNGGVVAFSIHIPQDEPPCESQWGLGGCRLLLYVKRLSREGQDSYEGLANLNPLQLDPDDVGLYGPAVYIAAPLRLRGDLVVLKLPEDYYEIWNWSLSLGGATLNPKGFQELYEFRVNAGKVNYFGRLAFKFYLEDDENLRFSSDISDKSEEDLPGLYETFPQFRGKVNTRIFKRIRL